MNHQILQININSDLRGCSSQKSDKPVLKTAHNEQYNSIVARVSASASKQRRYNFAHLSRQAINTIICKNKQTSVPF